MIRGLQYTEHFTEGTTHVFGTSGGVFYEVAVPQNTNIFSTGYLIIYHHITEKSQKLYGFLTSEDRRLFVDLISIDGFGPSIALKLMSSYAADKIRIDLGDGDFEDLSKAKGIGKKTAEKIVKAIGDKYKEHQSKIQPNSSPVDKEFLQNAVEHATKALLKLGFSKEKIKEALTKASEKESTLPDKNYDYPNLSDTIGNLVKAALLNL